MGKFLATLFAGFLLASASWAQVSPGNGVPVTVTGTITCGNCSVQVPCNASAIYDASTNGSTQLVALVSGKVIFVCGYTIFAAGTVNVELDYGTGSACAVGTTKIVPAYQLTAQTGISDQSPIYRGLNAPASNALCIKTSAGVAVQAIVYYIQQ